MKKGVFFPFLRRFFVRSIIVILLTALFLRLAEKNPTVSDWISRQLHTSVDLSYFLQ